MLLSGRSLVLTLKLQLINHETARTKNHEITPGLSHEAGVRRIQRQAPGQLWNLFARGWPTRCPVERSAVFG